VDEIILNLGHGEVNPLPMTNSEVRG